jgi:hypothetical protein
MRNHLQVNWDLYRAAKEGWAVLGEDARTVRYPNYPIGRDAYTPEQGPGWYGNLPTDSVDLERLPGDSLGWEFWDGFLRDPLKPKAKELEAAMKLLRLKVGDCAVRFACYLRQKCQCGAGLQSTQHRHVHPAETDSSSFFVAVFSACTCSPRYTRAPRQRWLSACWTHSASMQPQQRL